MTARRRLAVALLVPFGVVVSHLIAYAAARPQGSPRAEVVVAAHGHLGPLALVAALGVVGALMLCGYAGATGRRLRLTPVSLAAAQAGAFAAMEIGEHLAHGSTLSDALAEPSLWIGLALQLVIASAAYLLLRVAETIGERLARCRRTPWSRAASYRAPVFAVGAVRPLRWDPASRRGPPLLVTDSV